MLFLFQNGTSIFILIKGGFKLKPYKILAIAPYEEMRGLIELAAEKRSDIQVDIHVADLQKGAELSRQLQGFGYDAILSRGGTAALINRNAAIPVVDIHISAFDMLRVMQLAQDYDGRAAIVGFSSITTCAHLLCELLLYEISIITIKSESELSKVLSDLKRQGYSLIIGDTVTVPIAEQKGMHGILLTSGRESISAAMDQTVKLCETFELEKKHRLLLETILDGMETKVAVFDLSGTLIYSTFSQESISKLHRLMLKNINLFKEHRKMHHTLTKNGHVQIIKGCLTDCDGQPFIIYYGSITHPWKFEPENSVIIRNQIEDSLNYFDSFYDKSPPMRQLVRTIHHYSRTLQPILILGEQGTGKNTVANVIHAGGEYRDNLIVTIDCEWMTIKKWRALFENSQSPLIESHLTIFFKSVHLLKKELCVKLIDYISNTYLQKRNRLLFSYTVGCDKSEDSSKICYFIKNQLSALVLRIPPLRQRRASIPGMANLYLSKLCQSGTKQILGFTPGAIEQLQGYTWFHNIDQFQRIIRELYVVTENSYISEKEVKAQLAKEELNSPYRDLQTFNYNRTLIEMEQDILFSVLKEEKMNQSNTAKRLGISRSTLWRKLKSYGIDCL